MKNRIMLSNIIVLAVLIISKPDNPFLFAAGFFVSLAGEFIRMLAGATIVKSKTLTMYGIYASVRNPLYLGTFIMAFGFLVAISSREYWLRTLICWILAAGSFYRIYFRQIAAEEKFLTEKYGEDFSDYKRKVNSIFPKISSLGNFFSLKFCSKKVFLMNKEYRGFAALFVIMTVIFLRIKYGI